MCRSIKPLFNFDPPATDDEIRAAALQFARKLSGMGKPTAHNQATIEAAADELSLVARQLLGQLETTAAPKDRDIETAKAKARSAKRFS